MKKILVPTDFSPIAKNALDVAADIAKKNNAKIVLLNVKMYPTSDVASYYSLYGASGVSINDAWQEILEKAKDEMKHEIVHYKDVKIQPLVEESGEHFVGALLDHRADLIVMGSTGASGFKEFFSGSNSEEVVRMATCPVLVVKGDQNVFAPKKVVFAVDLTHEEFIDKAMLTLNLEDAEVHFLHVDDGNRKINYLNTELRMQNTAKKHGFENCKFEILNADSIESGILEYASDVEADLIIMYTHGRKGFNHFFRGSIAEDVVNHSKVSVFTYVEN
ncbi:universal stress protein [Lacihabitans sp. LS3-19]|uniref:universal stress protein n=1 Tax=Lacihabitans sp. LS3-19 TaxID=2487335 RepID=UPI0020CFC66D|nr:universal stress protein [Lacihabitans sp. LS3-19]